MLEVIIIGVLSLMIHRYNVLGVIDQGLCTFTDVNTLLTATEKHVYHNSITLVCTLVNSIPGLSCSLCSITISDHDVTLYMTFIIRNTSENVTFTSQEITIANLLSGTKYD